MLTVKDIQRIAAEARKSAITGELHMMVKRVLAIGIDPGTATGWAMWEAGCRQLIQVEGTTFFEAQDKLEALQACGIPLVVVLEDARKSNTGRFGRHFGNKNVLQGVGSIKRESKLWVEWLTAKGIPFTTIKPRRRATKKDADLFKRITGWPGRTNEHGRDAAMFVYGMNEAQVRQLIENGRKRA